MKGKSVRKGLSCCAVAVSGLGYCSGARGDRTYVGPASGANAIWSLPANWGGALPGSSEQAIIANSDSTSRTVLLDTNPVIAHLRIDNNGFGTNAILQNSFTMNANQEDIGYQSLSTSFGRGAYTQFGGLNVANDYLSLGSAAFSNGNYDLYGGTLVAGGSSGQGEFIGGTGNGTFNNFGGANTVGALGAGRPLYLGFNPQASGTYNLNGANAVTVVNGNVYAGGNSGGAGGQGVLNVINGSMTVNGTLKVWPSLTSAVALSGGSLTVNDLDTSSQPSRFQWTGGNFAINSALIIGAGGPIGTDVSITAAKNLTVGAAADPINHYEQLGRYNGSFGESGHITQSGGTHTVNGGLFVGAFISTGTYDMTGGILNVALGMNLGTANNSTGVFNQSGGVVTVGGNFVLGGQQSIGTYNVSGNGVLQVNGNASLGNFSLSNQSGDGVLAISGGTANIAGMLNFSHGFPTAVSLSSGTLNVGVIDFSGAFGSFASDFVWTGGTLGITGQAGFTVGTAGPLGQLTLAGGRALAVTNILSVTETGGLTLAGGSVSAGNLNLGGSPARLAWTAGLLHITGADGLNLSGISTSGASLLVSPGKTLAVDTLLALGSGGTLTYQGGGLSYGTLGLSGGTLSASAPLINSQLISGFGTLAVPAGMTNNGVIIPSGGNLIFNTAGTVTNNGTINLAPGFQLQANGGGTLVNSSDGIIAGAGTITGNFSNAGTIVVGGGSLRTPAFTNTGVIELADNAANFGTSTVSISNSATIEGHGKVSAAIDNHGTIEPTGGNLVLAGGVLNSNGTIRSAQGTKVLFQGAANFPTNAGVISIAGGTVDTGGQALNNTGQITGYGVLATGGLTNNGAITLTGGTTTVNGAVTNNAGKTINVKFQPAIFTGAVTNNGTFNVVSTTAVFAGGSSGIAFPGFAPQSITPPVGLNGSGVLTVSSGGLVQAGYVRQASATVSGQVQLYSSTQGGDTSVLNALAISAGATLDLNDNDLIVDYTGASPAGTVRSYLVSAFNVGAWNGFGIASKAANQDATSLTAIGYGENSLLGNLTTFAGQSVDGTSVLVKYTYYGDSNLDGVVNAADFGRFLDGLATGGTTWAQGDYTYDGKVDLGNDFNLFLSSYLTQGGVLGDLAPEIESDGNLSASQKSQLLSVVPEPVSVAMVPIIACVFATKRKRRA